MLGVVPALAAEDSQMPPNATVSPEAAKEATIPDQGSADTSTGAKEQSSAHPDSGAVKDEQSSEAMPDNSADPSSGAKEQSSAPPGSSADTNKPNPTLGAESSKPDQESPSSTE
jgi:hypothetical protein